MKKLLFLVLFVSIALFAQAQKGTKTVEEKAQARTDRMAEKLTLTAAQKEQIYALFLEQGANKVDGKKVRNLSQEERAAFKEERKAKKAAFDEQMSSILSAEQYATYKERGGKAGKKGKRGNEGKKNHKGKGAQGKKSPEERLQNKVDKLTEQLELSPAQQTQVKNLFEEQQANRPEKGAFKDMSEEDRAAAKEARQAAKAAFTANMQSILSAEQFATFEQLNQKRAGKGGKGKGRGKGKGKKRRGEEEDNK